MFKNACIILGLEVQYTHPASVAEMASAATPVVSDSHPSGESVPLLPELVRRSLVLVLESFLCGSTSVDPAKVATGARGAGFKGTKDGFRRLLEAGSTIPIMITA